jgi:flagellar protein FliO/FliZ
MLRICFCLYATLFISEQLFAETVQSQRFATPPSVLSTENMLQLSAGLLTVLAFIGLIAWLVKKIGIHPVSKSGILKIITSVSVGQRERVVLTEINDTWLVLGVAPGHVSLLHRMDKQAESASNTPNITLTKGFSEKLQANLKQNHDQ